MKSKENSSIGRNQGCGAGVKRNLWHILLCQVFYFWE